MRTNRIEVEEENGRLPPRTGFLAAGAGKTKQKVMCPSIFLIVHTLCCNNSVLFIRVAPTVVGRESRRLRRPFEFLAQRHK